MIFLTYRFVIFGAAALLLFWLVTRPRLRLPLLVVSCAVFHAHFAGPAGVLPILVLGAVTYLIGLTQGRRLCRLGIVVCALGLVFYKYTAFFCTEVLALASPRLGSAMLAATQPLMPGGPPLAPARRSSGSPG